MSHKVLFTCVVKRYLFLICYFSILKQLASPFSEFKEVSDLLDKFDIQIREEEEHAVIETEGYLNDALGEQLAERAHQLIQNGYTQLVINLEKTSLINSIGISILIEIIEVLTEREGTLNFCGLSATQERTFRMMAIAKYAGIFPDEESAVANL